MKLILFVGICVLVKGGVVQNGDDIAKRIVGGENTSINKYPWQLSLQRNNGFSWSHTCGASIISENWAVTAAHCVDGSTASKMRVVAGVTKLSDESNGQRVVVDEIIMHPDYDAFGPGFPNDVAVLKLSQSLKFGSDVSVIAMADDASGDFADADCDISGWGLTGGGASLPDNLQMVTMTVQSNQECSNEWKSVSGADINSGHICIGGTTADAGKSACNGDSGGPMTCTVGSNKVLAGATSWGIAGCEGPFPSVYTRIAYFREWIRKETGV